MGLSPVLLDSNVLIYAMDASSERFDACHEIVERSVSGTIDAVLLPQVLLETYAVVTSKRVRHPLPPRVAADHIEQLAEAVVVLPVTVDFVARLAKLARSTERTAQQVFDLALVAQLQSHGVGSVCTCNPSDFRELGVDVVSPEELLS